MAQALQFVHERDPKEELQEAVRPYLKHVEQVMGASVLVAVYEPKGEKKTTGGILVPDKTKGEYEYQGKVGLVLCWGPLAFVNDNTHRFGTAPAAGDWVLFRVGDTFPFKLGANTCRLVEDVDVKAILATPDVAY